MKKKINEKELAEKYFKLLKEQAMAEKQTISNYAYISWLEIFTQTHTQFTTDSWLYNREEISESDYENVEKLFLFFSAISSYCHKFYINIKCYENFEQERIHIKHNNVGYQLGLVAGQGSYVYVHREIPQGNAICFDDIMNNITPGEFAKKSQLLQTFEKIVSSMHETDIPSEIVIKTLKKYYNF